MLIDRDLAAAEKGKAHSAALLDKQIARGEASEADKARDLVAHHAFDFLCRSLGLRSGDRGGFRESRHQGGGSAAHRCRPSGRRHSRFQYLDAADQRPGREYRAIPASFIGIHFFSPVDRMQLVEIIKGKQTGDRALATALDFVRQIRKTPIVVNDSRGFFTSRVVMILSGRRPRTCWRKAYRRRSSRMPASSPACRSVPWRSPMKWRSISAGRSFRRPKPISARNMPMDRSIAFSRRWW